MPKFSDSSYDILKDYFDAVTGEGVGLGDSWLIGPTKGIIGEGGVSEILWEDNPQRGFVAHRFIIQDIDGNSFNMLYDGLVSTFSLASANFEVGNDFYFRKDSFFYEYLAENNPEFRDYISQERTFCYFGKIWPVSDRTGVWNIEFYGMKDYMELAIPTHNRTPRLVEMMDVWFDQINQEPYNMTKYLWALLDAKEVDLRWLEYIGRIYGIDINTELDELTLREWVDYLVYFLKRVGTYNAIYIVYKVFTALSENKLNVYERWDEWCQKGAGDIPSFKEFPNFFPGTRDFHWFEFYNIAASGGSGEAWYSQFNPSGAPTPNPYVGIEIDPYPTHALTVPSPSCSSVSASPTGSMVIAPHYIVEIDLTTEPIGDRFGDSWILNQFYADELVRNWEYARPVNKYVQYQQLISPACAQSRTGDPESLYPLTSLGYFNTSFTASQYLSGGAPTPSGGEVAFIYTQYGASGTWTITHELSASDHLVVQVWTPTPGPSFYPMTRIIPDTVVATDENTLTISFGGVQVGGIACIAGYIPNVSYEYDQVAPTNPWPIVHSLGLTAPSTYPDGSVINFFDLPAPLDKSYPETVEILDLNRTTATWDGLETGQSFVRNADYVHTQSVASTTWNIHHGMNSDGTIIQCYDSSNQLIEPLSVVLTDVNNTVVTFVTAQSGNAYMLYFKRDILSRINDPCDITGVGMCPGGLGYWKVGDGGIEEYNPYISNDLESPTASGNYWRVWSDGGIEDAQNYYIDFIVPTGEDLTIREVGLFNVDDILVYYSVCSELYKPAEVQTVFHYKSQALWFTESSSSSSSSSSISSSSTSSSSSSTDPYAGYILHETSIFAFIDGYIYKEADVYAIAGWQSSAPVSIPLATLYDAKTEAGGGGKFLTVEPYLNYTYIPDPPSHANATGLYRVVINTTSTVRGWDGIPSDAAHGLVTIETSSRLIKSNTWYDYDSGGTGIWKLRHYIIYEGKYAATDYNVTDTATRYYEGTNQAGKYVRFRLSAFATANTDRKSYTTFQMNSLINQTQISNGSYGWPTAHDATTGTNQSASTNWYWEAMATASYSGDTTFRVTRSFVWFGLEQIGWGGVATRVLQDSELRVTAYNSAGAGNDRTTNVTFHTSQFTQTEGALVAADFDNYGNLVSSVIDWREYGDNGWPYTHQIEFNSTGLDWVSDTFDVYGNVKFCMREYDHDYLNVSPVSDSTYFNGMYYRSGDTPQSPDNIPFQPQLRISYLKIPDWYQTLTPHTDWITVSGSDVGNGWDSVPSGSNWIVDLEEDGFGFGGRWCDFRVVFTGVSQLTVHVEDTLGNIFYDDITISSYGRVNIPWRGPYWDDDYDIFEMYFYSTEGEFFVNRIEFLVL